ncbi:MFS transporter, DHA2 family, multidrug resistance protein [Streptomyces sp. BpilaLS-43]|uniref:MFS transporter n=1 Tax=Streptomyces sp. BpilaLS-43 TaxID=1839778 RepID=UPI00081B956B|nr:MFS transporter [Streptomyces sp. BpilaLS-43]SCE10428.1 MFS transporter, DHA2 family, multidrug resistance protein [Streptomyces sp. BpilaLS-43]
MTGTSTAVTRLRTAAGGGNRWVVLVVLCLSLLVVALDATVLHVAVPAVTEDLRPSAVGLLWIVDAYPLVCASLLILFGTLGDRIGRRRVLLSGYALFGIASALAATADTPTVLIAARALLGVGGAMIMPATLSILRQVFPDRRERALAIGVWTAVAAVGAATGPVIGGFLVEHFWWGSVFLINIPLMAVVLPVGRWLLPESRGADDGPWDVLGALTAAAGVLGVVLGIKRLGSGGAVPDAATLVPLLAGAALLVLFVRRQRRRVHPLIDIAMFSRPAFTTAVGCIVLAMLALVGLELIAVQYLQLVLGLSPLETGLRLLPLTFAAMAAGATGSYTLRRVGPRRMVGWGFVLTAASVLLLTLMGQHDRPVLLTAGFVLLGFGLQSTLFGAYESMLSEAPAERAGGAAAIGETSYQLGAGMGIALLGSVMNAAYAPGLSRLHEEGVPAAAGTAASHSLGEAYQVAGRLGPLGHVLRTTARHAFVDGLHVTLLVSAGLLLLGALAALRLPRAMDCGQEAGECRDAAPQAAVPERSASRQADPDRPRPEARTFPAQGGPGSRHRAAGRREVAEATGSGRAGR